MKHESRKPKLKSITRIHVFVGGRREKDFVPLRWWNHFSTAYLITFIICFNRIVSHKDWVLNNLPIKKKKKGRERLQMCVNSEFSDAASVNIKH